MRFIALEEHFAVDSLRAANRELPDDLLPTLESVVGDYKDAEMRDLENMRLAFMDENDIDVQVLSHSPPATQLLEPGPSVDLAREANDVLAGVMGRHPDRFGGFAALPTPAPEQAAAELERCVSELGFAGSMIHGHTRGRYLDDPKFDPILETAAKLGAPIYLHPGEAPRAVSDAYYSGIAEGSPMAGVVDFMFACSGFGWHVDCAVHALRLVLTGAFDRHPDLQVILGHHGEMIPFYIDRIDTVMGAVTRHLERRPKEYLQQNFHFTPSGLEFLAPFRMTIETVGIERVMFSVDYPYATTRGRAFLEEAGLSVAEQEQVAHLNAERLMPALTRGA